MRSVFASAIAENRKPTFQEIIRISVPYLDAVVEEVNRHAMVALGVVRTATVDVEVLGRRIPKGTDVFLLGNGASIFSPAFEVDDSLRSQSYRAAKDIVGSWDPDGIAAFKPERWLAKEDGKEVFDATAGPLLAFGLGPRGCFGRRMAHLQLKLFIALIIWCFELQRCPEELSSYAAHQKFIRVPQQCYVKLAKLA
jgi:cytochrome P450